MKKSKARKVTGKSAIGATRKTKAAVKERMSFGWINRVLVLVAVGVVLTLTTKGFVVLNAIPVEHIIVSGKLEHTKTAALEALVRPALVGGFLNADLERVQQQLQSLPWVHEASVRRRWPNALELHVVEQLPIARWGEDGFINHEGVVFQSISDNSDWEALPRLSGPRGSASALMTVYQRAIEILAPHNLEVIELVIDDRGQVEASLKGGEILVLGGDDHVERLRRFVSIYRAELALNDAEVLRVDLRYSNGVAVSFQPSTHVAGL